MGIRGIVVTLRAMLSGNALVISSPDPQDLRRYVTYWDKIDYVRIGIGTGMFGINIDASPEMKLLKDENILQLTIPSPKSMVEW